MPPKNATLKNATSANAIIIYFENLNMREMKEARFRCLFVEKEESSSPTENFYIHYTCRY